MSQPQPGPVVEGEPVADLSDVKGQEHAKRALEIAAAGGHNILSFVGPPGSGKSMMAQRLPGSLLPPLSARELLETSMVHSVAGLIAKGALTRSRPFRSPHHSASMAALTGGGLKAKPGEVSLAHNGVLFLDELPEFSAQALDFAARGRWRPARSWSPAPMRTSAIRPGAAGRGHEPVPLRIGGAGRGACGKAPRCQSQYQSRISGPLMDRIDLQVEVKRGHRRRSVAAAAVRGRRPGRRARRRRPRDPVRAAGWGQRLRRGRDLEKIATLDEAGRALLTRAAEAGGLSARGWARTLRLARTIADLEGSDALRRSHIAEALIYRRVSIAQPLVGA